METYPIDEVELPESDQKDEKKPAKKKAARRNLQVVEDSKPDNGFRGQKRIAYRFARLFENKLIYTTGRGWLWWNGVVWEDCQGDSEAWRGVQETCQAAYQDLGRIFRMDHRDELYADIRRCDSAEGTAGVLKHAMRDERLRRRDDDLDAHPELFVVKNGTIELPTSKFRGSRPEDLMTLCAGVEYNPDATCPLYDSLFATFQEDIEIRDFFHRLGGAAMEGRQNLQKLIINHGLSGGNGKGTMQHAWTHVFGGYVGDMNIGVLTVRRGYDQYKDEKAQLKGKRLIYVSEPSEGERFDTGTVKGLTGGDNVTSRALYKSAVTFKPTWLIMMSTNNPVSTPTDGGMARRLRQIKWDYKVPEDKQDDTIDARLEAEGSGILNRILAGWEDFRDNGIQEPEVVIEGTKRYLAEVDPMNRFVEECIKPTPGAGLPSSSLYHRYVQWCQDNGEKYPKSLSKFSPDMEKRGFTKKRSGPGMVWADIDVVPRVNDF